MRGRAQGGGSSRTDIRAHKNRKHLADRAARHKCGKHTGIEAVLRYLFGAGEFRESSFFHFLLFGLFRFIFSLF